ncbi:bone morphogenetic protein 2-like [Palaemon carinicauda]|uniref:bone morphogenetic protein 2-like n=1 Tax=Palaemon carinicauda TaxID=392227 RepID=UPI0035B64E9D
MALAEIVVVLATVATCGVAFPPVALQEAGSLVHVDVDPKGPTKLLQAFGLSQPGVRRWHSEPPQYMLDLYNEVADPNGLTRLPGPYGSTVIRAFFEKDGSSESRFVFSVSGFEVDEDTLEAELHVYHSRLQKAHRHLVEDNLYLLEVSTEVGGERQVLAKQHVAAHSSGWRVFQVGNWLMKGTQMGREKEGEEEKGVSEDEKEVVLVVVAKTLLGRPLPLVFHHGLQGTRRPLLVFFNTYVTSDSPSVSLHRGVDKPAVLKKDYEAPSINRLRRSTEEETTVSSAVEIPAGCERRDMLVDFATIGWSSWIVYPTSYNAYQCLGQCSFPLGQDLNPTNHAIVQSIINNSGDFPLVQRPCCVPSTYGNLSLLYYNAEENVVLRQYDKMVATECGCL